MANEEDPTSSSTTSALNVAIGLVLVLIIVFAGVRIFRSNSLEIPLPVADDSDVTRPSTVGISRVSALPLENPQPSSRRTREELPSDREARLEREAHLQKLQTAATEREAIREEMTGTNAAERQAMRSLIRNIEETDSEQRKNIREELLAMQDETNVWGYLRANVLNLPPDSIREIFSIMPEIEPEETRLLVEDGVHEEDATLRALAIEHMAELSDGKDTKTVELVARGMVDDIKSVRIATAKTLGTFGDRRVTGLLVESLESADSEEQEAVISTLGQLWNDDTSHPKTRDPRAWKSFWETRERLIDSPLAKKDMSSLFDPAADRTTVYKSGT